MTHFSELSSKRRVEEIKAVTADGALAFSSAVGSADITTFYITKAATLAALTLAAPTTGTDDGKIVRVVCATAKAHKITCPSTLLNATSTIATMAAIGDNIMLQAYGGNWYILSSVGVTLS